MLAQKKTADPRVAERFELYVCGMELANGFGELRCPKEQRERFEDDGAKRARLGYRSLPIGQRFLDGLHDGLPPSSGVAMGVDRLLMLAEGYGSIEDALHFPMRRLADGTIHWSA